MRIVAGRFGGRRLMVPKNHDIRPTGDKIRGAVMNALRARGGLDGAHVLDGFCGTGALGLEALSQGAAHCVFIDKSRDSLTLAKENARILGLEEGVCFFLKDAANLGKRPDDIVARNLVFLDPPYHKGLVPPALSALHDGGWLAESCRIVCETEKNFSVFWPSYISLEDQKTYGDTSVMFLRVVAENGS